MKNTFKVIGKILKDLIAFLLISIFIILEEVVWDKFVYPVKKLIQKLISEKFVIWLKERTKYQALVLFLIPFIVAETMGFSVPFIMGMGFVLLGIIIYIVKIFIASISFWVFNHTKEKLLTISWFNYLYSLTIAFFNYIKNTKTYKRFKALIADLKEQFKIDKKGFLSYLKSKYKNYKEEIKKEYEV